MPVAMLSGEDLKPVVSAAVRRHVSVAITLLDKNRWLTFRGFLLAVDGEGLWIRSITGSGESPSEPMRPGLEVGLAFRMGSQKYSFVSRIKRFATLRSEDGEPVESLGFSLPTEVERMDRRIYGRTEVSVSDKARVSIWPGGRAVEPKTVSPHKPVWCGNLVDVSTRGFAVRTTWDAANYLETGDIVGARMLFGNEPVPLYVNAQLRHAVMEGAMGVLGFQFVGMELTEEGRAALAFIAERVKHYGG